MLAKFTLLSTIFVAIYYFFVKDLKDLKDVKDLKNLKVIILSKDTKWSGLPYLGNPNQYR